MAFNPCSFVRALLVAFFLGVGLSAALAQSALYVDYHGQSKLVRSARGDQAMVDVDGKLVTAGSHRYAIAKADEYLPVFVSIGHLKVETQAWESVDDTSTHNTEFKFYAEFTSAYTLGDVFVVLEFDYPNGTKSFFLRELGSLEPNRTIWRKYDVSLDNPTRHLPYILHLFVGGAEVLHSEQPAEMREAALQEMVTRRLANRPDGPPAPFIGPPPIYPPSFAATKTKGQAVLRVHVLASGAVDHPIVVKATAPEFGAAAVESMRQWRFLPRIKSGQPVESTVNVPVDFAPPEPAAEKS